MSGVLTKDEARRLRSRSQLLDSGRGRLRSPVEVTHHLGAIQAQVQSASALAVRARSTGLTQRDIDRALEVDRSLVRTWLLRGTLHMAAAEDIGWMLGLLGPHFAASFRRRRLQLGLDDQKAARGLKAIRAALTAQGPLTRGELVDSLGGRGVALDPHGQDRAHLIGLAALEGLICPGSREGGESRYVLLEDWIGKLERVPTEEALARLARRYFGACGPAGPEDLAAWSGLPATQARQAIRLVGAELTEVDVAGAPAWVLSAAEVNSERPREGRQVRLLPAFDTYLLGYRSRGLTMSAAAAARVQRGGGWVHPTVAVDGWVVAAWKMTSRRGRGEVETEPFEPISATVARGIEAEVDDIRRFLGAGGGTAPGDAT